MAVAECVQNRSDPAESTTIILVVLLGEGVEVWRPVQATPLGCSRFRIIGVKARPDDEIWQFRPAAAVRCEQSRFAEGTKGLSAVEKHRDEARSCHWRR